MKKYDFEDFQAFLEKKLKVLLKKICGKRNAQNYPNNSFLYLEVDKTTSRWIFWRKSKNKNFAFLKKKFKYFSRMPVQAQLEIFFVEFVK